ncbi:FecR domain-containing protein [uncultured Zobellia sp.]|uniref:FecR family protein n=1 Tax=uncultured Zobellia sp. TaxID=255433 RepID=UPI002593655B|nr:FecR domain-containing protein [uncultured Zobellia sp.]
MKTMDIAPIIVKKLKDKLTDEERFYFDAWINDSEENKSLFRRLQAIEKKGGNVSEVLELDIDADWHRIVARSQTQKRKNQLRSFQWFPLKYAALLIVGLTLGLGYLKYGTDTDSPVTPTDAITLQLGNGEVKVISPNEIKSITNKKGSVLVKQVEEQLDYSIHREATELSYNTLKVPYGKRFTLILSDSTIVHLNAGSSLKYPVKFIPGQNRQVFLSGEGYFNVYKDKRHPFVVSAGGMDVQVLGTQFNISSYSLDRKVSTVLVEGSVMLYPAQKGNKTAKGTLLQPGYKADWDKFHEQIDFEKVDTHTYTNWVKGVLVLKRTSFKQIIEKLQRHYNVTIENRYEKLNGQVFTATFDVETIDDVLNSFTLETPFEYQITDNHIIIFPPK